ncbi:MAG: hypothetical protein ACXWXT_02400 [Candidatus Binatia bacterium]
MADKRQPEMFDQLMQSARAFQAATSDTEARMKKIRLLLEALVNDPNMCRHSKTWLCTESRNNLLLYEDPNCGFVVNAVVRTPEREGRVRDHAHAWTVYGVLDGLERLERLRV